MLIDIKGRPCDVSFNCRATLAEMTTFLLPPSPLGSEFEMDDPKIVQGAFDRVMRILELGAKAEATASKAAQTPVMFEPEILEQTIMDLDPAALREMASTITTLLAEIRVDTESLEPFCNTGSSIDDCRSIVADQVLPIEMEGTLELYGVAATNLNGEPRTLMSTGNSPRARSIAVATAIAFYLLPAWVEMLSGVADSRESKAQSGGTQ